MPAPDPAKLTGNVTILLFYAYVVAPVRFLLCHLPPPPQNHTTTTLPTHLPTHPCTMAMATTMTMVMAMGHGYGQNLSKQQEWIWPRPMTMTKSDHTLPTPSALQFHVVFIGHSM